MNRQVIDPVIQNTRSEIAQLTAFCKLSDILVKNSHNAIAIFTAPCRCLMCHRQLPQTGIEFKTG